MAESQTTLGKKLISLNKTFNTFPSAKSKESNKNKKLDTSGKSFESSSGTQSTQSTSESSECLASNNRKSSLFSSRFSNGKSDKSNDKLVNDKIELTKSSNSSSTKKSSTKSTSKYTSFFTSSINTSTKSTILSTSANSKTPTVKPTSTLSTIYSTTSSLSDSPSKSPSSPAKSSSLKGKTANQTGLPKFKFNKKKTIISNEQQQWHTDSQLSSAKTKSTAANKPAKDKTSSSFKSHSQALKSKTAKTFANTIVNPIKRSSIKFENKRLLFTSTLNKPKIIESLDDDFLLDKKKSLLDDQYAVNQATNTGGLKVSFDEEMKIDRHRSNSDNARIGKKSNLISSLRRSIFANQSELNQLNLSPNDRSLSLTTNKSLSNRMMGMISKGTSCGKGNKNHHLAIVRSHSLESNKFASKRVSLASFTSFL